jgi:DNA-binding response OmpR family regulator
MIFESSERMVLVVEDAESCAANLEIALVRLPGVAVTWVRTAEEALQGLAKAAFSALITDLQLPLMDGFTLIERVRSEPRHARMPVVVISADSDPATPERVLRMGANAFFPKPYSPAEVRNRVEQLIDAS